MIKNRALYYLGISLLISLLAVWGGYRWVTRQVEVRTTAQFTRLVVAAVPVPAGSRLSPGQLRLVDWPANNPLPGSFNNLAPLNDRVNKVPLAVGEPLLEAKLAPVGNRAGLSAAIQPGLRAVSIHVNEVGGVAGFALPGSLVDVVVTLQEEGGRMISKIVLQKILVLAVAQDAAVKDEVKAKVTNTVTLEVTPQQAEQLDLAGSVGTLALALRNELDEASITTPGVHKNELLGLPNPLPEQVPPHSVPRPSLATAPQEQLATQGEFPSSGRALHTVEVIRGTVAATTPVSSR